MLVSRLFWVSLLFVALLSACVSRTGVESFALYKQAFDEAKAVSDSVFDELSISERKLAQRVLDKKRGRLALGTFDPNLAIYYATEGDPPFTAAYKNAFAVVDRYNSVMIALATGEGFPEIRERSDALVSQLTTLSQLLSSASPAGPLGGIGLEAATQSILNPIRDLVLAARSRAVFQESFVATFPLVEKLILRMRNGTDKVYQVLTTEARRQYADLNTSRDRQKAYRATLSNWVVMLDRTLDALRAAKRAVERGRELGVTFTDVTLTAGEILKTTAEVRKQLAKLRASRTGQ